MSKVGNVLLAVSRLILGIMAFMVLVAVVFTDWVPTDSQLKRGATWFMAHMVLTTLNWDSNTKE